MQVITKNHPSAFTGTDLQKAMEGFGKKKIVLAGTSLPSLTNISSKGRRIEREIVDVCVCVFADMHGCRIYGKFTSRPYVRQG